LVSGKLILCTIVIIIIKRKEEEEDKEAKAKNVLPKD